MTRWPVAVVFVLALPVACRTPTSQQVVRDLPVGLAPAGALLTGCAAEESDGLVRARCDDDVTMSMVTRRAGVAEPRYREEAFSLGGSTGARISWDRMVVPTEGPSGAVDRARALAPLATHPIATLIGTVRDIGGHDVQEVWCSSKDDRGDQRCRELVGAVLGAIPGDAGARSEPASATASSSTTTAAPSGPVTVFGRALSLPTSCSATLRPDGGDATCVDGASLSWRKLDSMGDASELLTGTLAALGLADGQPYPCTLAGEVGQCEDRGSAVAGLAYLDGAPVAVACLGAKDARTHALCTSIMRGR